MHRREHDPYLPISLKTIEVESEKSLKGFVRSGETLFGKHLDITHPMNTLDESLNEFSRALEIRPESSELLGKVANILVKKGNYGKAESLARKALHQDTHSADAHFVLGYIAYKSQNYARSLEHLHQAIRNGGLKTGKFRFCLAYTYHDMAEKAKKPVNRFLRISQSLYYFLSGLLFIGMEPGRIGLHNIFRIFPTVIGAYAQENGNNIDGALTSLLKLYERFPGLSSLQNMIGSLYMNKGLHDEAIYWYQKAIYRDPINEEGHLQLARILEERGEYDRALELYRKLLALKPNNAEVHCSIGNVFYMNNQFEETLQHYRAAMQLSSDNQWKALLAQSISRIYQDHLPNREAAMAALEMAIELNPDDVDNYVQLGVLYFEAGYYGNAEVLYEQALRKSPRNPQLYSSLGYLKWMGGEIPEAVALYEKAIELDPFYDIPNNNLGVIQLDTMGNVYDAIDLFQRAIYLNDKYALAYYNLGRAHSFLGNKLEAANCFKKAQELNEFTCELDNEELEDRIFKLFNSETP